MTAVTLTDLALKPRLRGVMHQWACAVSLICGVALVLQAGSARAVIATVIYAVSVVALFGTSAAYHRLTRPDSRAHRYMRRLDHTMIFVLIAGSYTPFALLVIPGALGTAILIVVWAAALAGACFKLAWLDAPPWLTAAAYVATGWIVVIAFPSLLQRLGLAAVILMGVGGLLYSVGALVYALKRPDPSPAVFGYHEVFHVFVILAASLQYAVVAFWIL